MLIRTVKALTSIRCSRGRPISLITLREVRIKKLLAVATAATTLVCFPGVAHADELGYFIVLNGVQVAAFDDDGFDDDPDYQSQINNITLPGKLATQSTPAHWHFGGCSGHQGNGEVWADVAVTATFLSVNRFQLDVKINLYEDTSSTCGDQTLNYPTSQLDRDGSAMTFVQWRWADGAAPSAHTLSVKSHEPSTYDKADLNMGWQAFPSWVF